MRLVQSDSEITKGNAHLVWKGFSIRKKLVHQLKVLATQAKIGSKRPSWQAAQVRESELGPQLVKCCHQRRYAENLRDEAR